MKLHITLSGTYQFPKGTKVQLAPTGMVSGVILPNGEVLKPWINIELYSNKDGDEVLRDLTTAELEERGIFQDLQFDCDIDIEG